MKRTITLTVIPEDFENAEEWNPARCVYAQALKRLGYKRPWITATRMAVTHPVTGERLFFDTPGQVRDFQLLFDHKLIAETNPKPITLRVSVAQTVSPKSDEQRAKQKARDEVRAERIKHESKKETNQREARAAERMRTTRRGYALS